MIVTEQHVSGWRADYLRLQAIRLETRAKRLMEQAATYREQADSIAARQTSAIPPTQRNQE